MANLKFNLKQLSTGGNVSTIKVEHDKITQDCEKQLRALAVILGGYNQYGRKMDVDLLPQIKERFSFLINEVSELID